MGHLMSVILILVAIHTPIWIIQAIVLVKHYSCLSMFVNMLYCCDGMSFDNILYTVVKISIAQSDNSIRFEYGL